MERDFSLIKEETSQWGEEETYDAFKKHFDEQLTLYRSVNVLTLTELAGKEKVIGDAFLNNVLRYNSQGVTYVTFDFHEYCRGMKFENVSILTAGIKDIIKHMRYCWVDKKGMICEQRGVFRVNCVDCLDRTNVVQTAIARIVMETQCRKLGLLAPEESLPENCRKIYQQMWANNGDAISKQYAGTAALKGDFTRTGERKISGMMKDGVNSANRYYLRFKDTYRQAAIDLTHGRPVSEEALSEKLRVPEEDVRELMEKEENVKQLIEDCKKMLIVEPEECMGGWSLINADPVDGDSDRQEMDMILLLSQRAVYVAWYDDEDEAIYQYQRIFLEDIEKIEIGPEPSLFKSKNVVMRLFYHHYADEGFFHSFRSPGTRLFNNLVITVKTMEEAREQLNVVCEAFAAAQTIMSMELEVVEKQKLEKKKSGAHPEIMDIHQQLQETSLSNIRLPRDISSNDIPSQASSRGNSPMFGRKLIPSPTPARREKKAGVSRQAATKVSPTDSSSGSAKSWLTNISKLNPQHQLGSFDLAVPKFNVNIKSQLNRKSQSLVKNLKSGGAVAGRLLSKVPGGNIFSQRQIHEDTPQDDVDAFDVEVDDTVVAPLVTVRDRKRTVSRDDSSLDEPPEITDADLEKEVVLDSCGILATNTKQIIESPQYSFEDNQPLESDSSLESSTESTKPGEQRTAVFNIGGDSVYPKGAPADSSEDMPAPGAAILRGKSSSFNCYCEAQEKCPHDQEPVWVKQEKPSKPTALNLGQSKVLDNSEADKILAKYTKAKKELSHPNMKTSLSDTAIASSGVTLTVSNVTEESPKTTLELSFEMNSALQQKLPNLLQSSRMPRKTQRIYDSLKLHIEKQLGETVCQSTVIFI